MELESTKRKRLEEAYIAYADDVYRILVGYAGGERHVSDVVHEIFLRYYEKVDEVEEEMVLPWLIRVGKNRLFNVYRHDDVVQAHNTLSYKILRGQKDISVEDEIIETETCGEMRKFRHNIFEHLSKEHPLWYEALMKVYVMDIPQKDAAEQLGISVRVLHSRLHRAKRWISKNYKTERDELFGDF